MRILVVEDEKKIASFIKRGLKEERYAVDIANNGQDGLFLAEVNPYDVIILDIMLPVIDGISVCRRLRENNIASPVLILTARNNVQDKVNGLDAGADDYLTKPFAFDELLARVRALLRRNTEKKTTHLHMFAIRLT